MAPKKVDLEFTPGVEQCYPFPEIYNYCKQNANSFYSSPKPDFGYMSK
jgi:hypothetical protein